MKMIKKLWINFTAPALMIEVLLMLLTVMIILLCGFGEALAIFVEVLFILVELVFIASTLGLTIYTVVRAAKEKNTLAVVLAILFAGFYCPFYHQQKEDYSIAWPIVSVSLLGISYLVLMFVYIIYMFVLVAA